ncbi:exodeoxyribonuclease VII small subunit [Candidatus Saccharibacteria bacterium]|nr:exodeoxyribonuclease VII small subunit [Candidatus Saccharibacteria bacterium]
MAKAKPDKTYQQMTDELNKLVEWFESDSVNIDDAVTKYEQAMELLAKMDDYLKTAENKIKKIAIKFDSE